MNTVANSSTNQNSKNAALASALSQIQKQFGKGAVMPLGSSEVVDAEVVPTGSPGLDTALGVYGLPLGRIIEIFGPESSGKSTLALQVVAEAQKEGKVCAFLDVEHALDPTYAKAIGVDANALLISQPDSAEQALESVEILASSGAVDVIVVDSVAALCPRAELEGEMGSSAVGLHSRLMSQACRKLTAVLSNTNTMCIFINQIRMKIGILMGNPETTTGGNALKFYASVRLDIRRTGSVKVGDEVLGNEVRIKVVKNKLAAPFKQVQTRIMYGIGIDKHNEILDLGIKVGLIDKRGTWFSHRDNQLGQGRDAAIKALRNQEELCNKILEQAKKLNN